MERLACRSQRWPRFCNRLTDHHAPSAEALEQPARGGDGGVREELVAEVVLRSAGRSAFGGKPENIAHSEPYRL
jgi:hypothetical protein